MLSGVQINGFLRSNEQVIDVIVSLGGHYGRNVSEVLLG